MNVIRVVARDPQRPNVIYLMCFRDIRVVESFLMRLAKIGCSARVAA